MRPGLSPCGKSLIEIIVVHHGLGRHIELLEIEEWESLEQGLEISIIWGFFYVIVNGMTRYSVLLFYWRIFHVPSFKVPVLGVAAVVTASIVAGVGPPRVNPLKPRLTRVRAQIVTLAVTCIPLEAVWDLGVGGRCMNLDRIYLGNSIPGTVIDAILLAMPVPMLLRVQVNKAQKLALLGVFALGGL